MIKIEINGFGRIGRLVFRIASQRNDIEIVAVNDLLEVEHLAYLLQYDSVHGRFSGEIEVQNGSLLVNGNKIRVSAEKDPENLKWNEVGAELVLDCTGVFKEKETASAHLKAGAKKVVLSAPSKTAPMFVMGVNHKKVKASDTIRSEEHTSE